MLERVPDPTHREGVRARLCAAGSMRSTRQEHQRLQRFASTTLRRLMTCSLTMTVAGCRAGYRRGPTREPGAQLSSSFFFNDTATPEIYTLSLHDALPI